MGDSEQALEYLRGLFEANPQNIHNLAAEAGPSSFDVKLNNVTSVVYQLPFGKGRKWGGNAESGGGCGPRRMGTQHHQLPRTTGTPLERVLRRRPATTSSARCRTTIAASRFLRPNVSGSAASQSSRPMLNTYFAGYTFRRRIRPTPVRQCGPQRVPRSGLRTWDFAVDKNLPDPRAGEGYSSARSSSTS